MDSPTARRHAVATALCLLLAATACRHDLVSSIDGNVSTQNTLDFGEVLVGEAKVLSLPLTNASAGPLSLLSARVETPFAVTFAPVTISGGAEAAVELTFSPQAAQPYDQTLTLALDSPDAPTVTVHLLGTGVAPQTVAGAFVVTPSSLSFTSRFPALPPAAQFQVRNTGGTTLRWSLGLSAAGALTVSPTSGTLSPGAAVPVTVQVAGPATAAASFSRLISVDTREAGSRTVAVSVEFTSDTTPPPPPPPPGCDDVTNACSGTQKCCNHACVDVGAGAGGLCPCTADGATTFGAGTLIIPMDACWQPGADIPAPPSYCTSNARLHGSDAPLKAYGLVYFLLRHQVTVYMAIDAAKTAIDAVDLSLTSADGKAPVTALDWRSGLTLPLANDAQTKVDYRGAPFLIDSSQNARVLALLATEPDFAQFRAAGTITLHVARGSFQTAVAKSISVVPSRIALLQVPPTSSLPDSPTDILVRYLHSAGLDFAGAGGTPSAPGQIYDVLQESDFLPDYDHSNLKARGYKLLWAPHWEGGTKNTPAQLASIGAHVNAGGDLFAECAAIGTLEGVPAGSAMPGAAATRFQTTNGVAINLMPAGKGAGSSGPFTYRGFAAPFAQRGDFPFASFNGLIFDYHPDGSHSSAYRAGVQSYISGGSAQTELFTALDQHAAGKGTVVYLAGHDYSYNGRAGTGTGVTAGSRLVLNTLFSLGTNNICQPQN